MINRPAVTLIIFNLLATVACRSVIKQSQDPWIRVAQVAYSLGTHPVLIKDGQVDCLGLGSLVAKALEWLLKNDPRTDESGSVNFLLYTRNSTEPRRFGLGDDLREQLVDFKVERPTVFIVHGFLATGDESWIRDMSDAYLELSDVNVFVVYWSIYANTWNYYRAVTNARISAVQVALFLKQIVATFPEKRNWGRVHMIGHSLGAHVCGLAAAEFNKEKSRWKIARITGLDPAQSCYVDTELSLSSNDAPFVDVIHTNGKAVGGVGLGLLNPIGHMDFYLNGGQRQPCCRNQSLLDAIGIPYSDVIEAVCSHRKSYHYFTESLVLAARQAQGKFCGHRWNTMTQFIQDFYLNGVCTRMGINADKRNETGTFFVAVACQRPYSELTSSDLLSTLDELRSMPGVLGEA